MKKAVIYIRVSSKEQREEGYSIPAQRKLLWEYARVNDFNIIKEFEDDETAKSAGRSGFGEMITFIQKNKVDTILVEKTDRLYRNFKDYVTIDDLGVTVFLIKENEKLGKDASSHQKFIHGIKVLMAKNYIDNLSEEVRKGLKQKAESGFYPCSTPPIGYKFEKKDNKSILVIDDDNKLLPIKMFEYYSTGLYSLKSLVYKVESDGLLIFKNLPKYSKMRVLTKSSAQRILTNPAYCGNFLWKGDVYKGSHESLIDKELWNKVQSVLKSLKNKGMLSKYNTLDFVFKGLIKCGECGRNITATRKTKPSGKKYVYYSCTKFNTNCPQEPIKEEELDKQIIELLEGLKLPPEVTKYITDGLQESLCLKQETEDKTKGKLEDKKNVWKII